MIAYTNSSNVSLYCGKFLPESPLQVCKASGCDAVHNFASALGKIPTFPMFGKDKQSHPASNAALGRTGTSFPDKS